MLVLLVGLLQKAIGCASGLIFVGLIAEKVRTVLVNIRCKCRVDLSGKIVIVTGGNSGIGFETAKILAKRGARVIIASRDVAKSQAAEQAIIDCTGNLSIEYKPLDLSKFSSIKQFADDFNRTYDRLDVLINNSGMFEWEQNVTEDGIERVTQVNHVGPTYLTSLLLDKLIASKPSRIIFVSSSLHKCHDFDPYDVKGLRPLHGWFRYANTKLGNILVARALANVLPDGVTVNSLHPGTAPTEIFDSVPGVLKKPLKILIECFFKTTVDCAQSSVHLAMAPAVAQVTGQYFDECKIIKPDSAVTDELADRVWKNVITFIEDKTNNNDC